MYCISLRSKPLSISTARGGILCRVKRIVLLYGLSGGLPVAALKLAEYRFLVVENSIQIYAGLIALVFTAVGVRLGLTLTKTKPVVVFRDVPGGAKA
jgi:hypothetical protein